jgi:hypothetical protein
VLHFCCTGYRSAMTMLAVALLTIVAVLFHLRRATPILHLAIDRPASSHPRSPPEKAPNPPRQKTGSVQIPIAPDAPPRHIFRGFLLWRFADAGPRCAPRHLHGAGIRKPSQQRKSAVHTWPLADAVRHRRCFRSMLQPQSRRCSNMQHVGRPKPSEGGGVREAPPHVSYDMLCLSSSQEID